jgi:SAM-dependent methyltransferase
MTIDLTKLPPAEMARHLGNPQGEIGVAVGLRINQTNGNITSETYRRLELVAGMDAMEIGPANGHLLPELLQQAPNLHYVGIDISATMVGEACRFNADRVASGQATFHLASADRIPAAGASFDRVFAVNVIYFWPDAIGPLREIRRVLRPSGFSLIAAVTPETMTGNSVFSLENGFHLRDADTLVALHKEAGFSRVSVDLASEVVKRPDGTPWKRHFNMVFARP